MYRRRLTAASEAVPLLGEAKLRLLMRKPTGRVTVPVLEDRGAWYTDSFDIALHADTIGSSPRLIPPGQEGDVEAWNLRSARLTPNGSILRIEPAKPELKR